MSKHNRYDSVANFVPAVQSQQQPVDADWRMVADAVTVVADEPQRQHIEAMSRESKMRAAQGRDARHEAEGLIVVAIKFFALAVVTIAGLLILTYMNGTGAQMAGFLVAGSGLCGMAFTLWAYRTQQANSPGAVDRRYIKEWGKVNMRDSDNALEARLGELEVAAYRAETERMVSMGKIEAYVKLVGGGNDEQPKQISDGS